MSLPVILAFASLVINVLLLLWIYSQERRLRKLLSGKGAETLEDTLGAILKHLLRSDDAHAKHEARIADLQARVKKSVRFVKTKRFNPFVSSGDGGNQSFATVFLDEEGDGVVLSSLYSRDRVSVYAKPLLSHASEFKLSKEEQDVLNDIRDHQKTDKNK